MNIKMASTIEKARSEDPRELKKRIAELEGALRKAEAAKPATEIKEVPVFSKEEREIIEVIRTSLEASLDEIETTGVHIAAFKSTIEAILKEKPLPHRVSVPAPRPSRTTSPVPPSEEGAAKLPLAEHKIMCVLAQYPQGRSKVQVALLCGSSHSGGSFNNALGALRKKRFIVGGDTLQITDKGLANLRPYEPLPKALLNYWLHEVGLCERRILEALAGAYPRALSKEEVATQAGYGVKEGGFNNALDMLRTLELISGRGEIRISETLFE